VSEKSTCPFCNTPAGKITGHGEYGELLEELNGMAHPVADRAYNAIEQQAATIAELQERNKLLWGIGQDLEAAEADARRLRDSLQEMTDRWEPDGDADRRMWERARAAIAKGAP